MSGARDTLPLNRDAIKYMAMFTMLLNHIANVFMPAGSLRRLLCVNIGYFTAITMCFFLVEGYEHTRSKKRYALRLGLFALLSELPYCLAFSAGGGLRFIGMNMIFTLLLCFLIILVLDRLNEPVLKFLCVLALTLVSIKSDWGVFAPLFTVLFIWSKGDERRLRLSYLISMLTFGLYKYLRFMGALTSTLNILNALGGMAAIALSGLCVIRLYNGRRAARFQSFSKWFFYLFYPLHLLILGLIRVL